MIEVFCRNRLGNALFLYAVGRHLAIKNNTGLRLHLASRNGQDHSILGQLSYFNLQAEVLTANSDGFIAPPDANEPLSGGNAYVETKWGFNPQVLNLKDGTSLDGNFQCEKYFKEIEQTIRHDFLIKGNLFNGESITYLEKIRSTNSIAVHVRRGDYVNLESHNVCNKNYYSNSIQYMDTLLDEPNYFLFSDDINWCAENFNLANCTFVDLSTSKSNPVIDFKLMSQCKHNIIANSTFSWWPAWLNAHPGKIVVGPRHWFKNEDKLDWVICQDTIPDHWVRIDF